MAPPLASPAPPSETATQQPPPAGVPSPGIRQPVAKQTLMGVAPADLGVDSESLDPRAPQAPATSAPAPADHSSQPLTWRVATGAEVPPEMSSAEVVTAYLRGEIDDETHFWREGMTNWLRAHEVPELRTELLARGLSPKAPSAPPRVSLAPAQADPAEDSPFAEPELPPDPAGDDFDDVTVALDINKAEGLLRESTAPPPAAEPQAPLDDLRAPLRFDELQRAPVAESTVGDWQRPSSHSLPAVPTPAPPPMSAPAPASSSHPGAALDPETAGSGPASLPVDARSAASPSGAPVRGS